MRIFTNPSRSSYGILLILLIICISGVFFSMHNTLSGMEAKTSLTSIIFMILSIAIAIIFFQQLAMASTKYLKASKQLDQLKKSIQETKKETANNADKQVINQDVEINYEVESKALIPEEPFENQELFVEKILSNIAKKHEVVQGVMHKKDTDSSIFSFFAGYAYFTENQPPTFTLGETLPGQVAKNKKTLNLKEVPEDYITVLSGLGQGSPKHLLILPIVYEDETIGIIELASFKEFGNQKVKLLEKTCSLVGEHLKSIGNSIEE